FGLHSRIRTWNLSIRNRAPRLVRHSVCKLLPLGAVARVFGGNRTLTPAVAGRDAAELRHEHFDQFRRSESNPLPTRFQQVTLPLSYTGSHRPAQPALQMSRTSVRSRGWGRTSDIQVQSCSVESLVMSHRQLGA